MKFIFRKKGFNLLGLLLFCLFSFAQSKINSPNNINTDFSLTTKINSTGHFPYSGSLLNHHLNVDFTLYYRRHNLGFFIFKSFDLEDLSSDVNYLEPGVFARIPIGKKFTASPYAGFVFDQTESFADKSSDIFIALVTTFRENNIKIENTALIFNFLETGSHRYLTNRLEVNVSLKNATISWFAWHKTGLFGVKESVSTALSFKSPKLAFTKSLALESSIMFHTYLTCNKPSYALRRGVVFSLLFPFDFKSK